MKVPRRWQAWKDLGRFDNRVQLILDRVLFRATTLNVYRLGRLQMLVENRAADAGSIRQCLNSDMLLKYLSRLPIAEVANVLDIGANAGGFSLLLMALQCPLRNLLCVELNPRTCERLRFNVLTNAATVYRGHAAVTVINAAIAAHAGELEVDLGIGSTADSVNGTRNPDGAAGEKEDPLTRHRIRAATLDELVTPAFGTAVIDLCKIDIEGAEEDVILQDNSSGAVLARARHVLMEIHHRRSSEQIVARLAELGLMRVAGDDDRSLLGVSLFTNSRFKDTPGPVISEGAPTGR